MLKTVQHRPILIFTLAFNTGIVLAAKFSIPIVLLTFIFAIAIIALAIVGADWKIAVGSILFAGFASGAFCLTAYSTISSSDISRFADRQVPVTVAGTIADDPDSRPGRTIFLLRAESVQTRDSAAAVNGLVYVTLARPATSFTQGTLDYGDRFSLRGHLERPRDATNPGGFSWRDYLARRSVYSTLHVKDYGSSVQTLGTRGRNPALSFAWAVRSRVLIALHESLPPIPAAALGGILIGRRAELPPDLMQDFIHTGTVHILASAGLHVGIIALWLMALCNRLTLPRKASAVGIVSLLWLYVLMAGGRPSVTRAVIMATVYFGAILFEREADLATTIAVAALVILLGQPSALFDPGFQLSFLTVITLAAAMPVWHRFWSQRITTHLPKKLRKPTLWAIDLIGVSLFAQLGSAPIVAATYNEFSYSGLAANLLVVPILFALIPLAFVAILVYCLLPAAAAPLFAIVGFGVNYITTIVRVCGEAGWSYRAIETPSWTWIAGYYTVVLIAAYWAERRLVTQIEPVQAKFKQSQP